MKRVLASSVLKFPQVVEKPLGRARDFLDRFSVVFKDFSVASFHDERT